MPVYPCKHQPCTAYVAKRGDFCDAHAVKGRQERAQRDRFYDQHLRDPEARKFYASAAWQRARRRKLAKHPVCQRCRRVFAQHVHHRIPLKRCAPWQRTAMTNLLSVCPACHNIIEKETECSSK